MFSLKTYLRNLNVFPPSSNNEELEDDSQHQSNIIATRIFILTLILSLFGISIALLLMYQTTMITINQPTREQFELLPKNAKCSCSRISFSYGKFTSLQASFHQVCSSDFVTDRWLKAISSGVDSTYFNNMDFRTYGTAQFQALAAFCRLSKAGIDQSITHFYQSTLLSPQVLSEDVFQSQIRVSINQFQITAPNTFKSQLRLINEMTIHNQLISALPTNFMYSQYYSSSNGITQLLYQLWYNQSDGIRCDCRTDFCGNIPSLIVDVFGASYSTVLGSIRWFILGISSGCLPVTSILVSTLECFYDQTCVNKLISYFLTIESFTAMIYNNRSVYNQNSTIESIADNLMIEDWMINISYD
ncbi:unnamed protein product, partial [Adineta steineri]